MSIGIFISVRALHGSPKAFGLEDPISVKRVQLVKKKTVRKTVQCELL